MGKHFGELAFIRGIVYYKLSPHEQKPFAGALKYGIPNFVTRASPNWMYYVPPFIIGYLIYKTCEEIHYQDHRKNPKDYADEVPPVE